MDFTPQDRAYMLRALDLAQSGWGWTSPNPLVGAVIVKNGRIIGEGFHKRCGENHAEVEALKACTEDPEGATVYVTLEPCSHVGRTPPCSEALIEAKVGRVVAACFDPNPLVAGRGFKQLAEAGVEVKTGLMETEALRLNEIFLTYITEKRPFVILKTAMTLDGRIATSSGDSQWISSPSSRSLVHKLRSRVAGVLTGVGTLEKDNPLLTARELAGTPHQPWRIIVDTHLRAKPEARIFRKTGSDPDTPGVLVACVPPYDENKARVLRGLGVDFLDLPTPAHQESVDLKALLAELYRRGLDSVMIEAGPTLSTAFLQQGLVDKLLIYIAPKLLGGRESRSFFEGENPATLQEALDIKHWEWTDSHPDLCVEAYLKKPVWQKEEYHVHGHY